MTIIAWDGKTLAADKASTAVGYQRTVTKIFRVPDGLVGFAGGGYAAMALLEWFKNGRIDAYYPKSQCDDGYATAMFIDKAGHIYSYEKVPIAERCEDRFDAMGAGRDYALAAMYLGHDARRAVEVTCALDVTCGCGIDTLTLDAP